MRAVGSSSGIMLSPGVVRSYIDMSDLRAGVDTDFVVEIEKEAADTLHDNTFSQLTQTIAMEESDGPDDGAAAAAAVGDSTAGGYDEGKEGTILLIQHLDERVAMCDHVVCCPWPPHRR